MSSMALDTAVAAEHSRHGEPRRIALGAVQPHRVAIDGVPLAYDEEPGPEPAVVCLHAIGHGASDFTGVRDQLRGRHRVLALDWPGHGCSTRDQVPASAARYAQLLGGWLDRLAMERPVLVGNSIGGAVAIRYAAAHPDRVTALVLENPGGLSAVDATARVATSAMARFFAAGARGARWYGPAFGAYYRTVLRQRPAAAQRARIVAAAYEMAPVLRDAWRSFGQPDADLRPLIASIPCPVLFAWATQDQFVQLRRSRAAIARFSNARLETFRAGHAAHLERPAAFAESLNRFLGSLPA